MVGEKFALMQYSVSSILGMIEAEQFVIPEIQRPFVWKRAQVRDLIDSLYNGYPSAISENGNFSSGIFNISFIA